MHTEAVQMSVFGLSKLQVVIVSAAAGIHRKQRIPFWFFFRKRLTMYSTFFFLKSLSLRKIYLTKYKV